MFLLEVIFLKKIVQYCKQFMYSTICWNGFTKEQIFNDIIVVIDKAYVTNQMSIFITGTGCCFINCKLNSFTHFRYQLIIIISTEILSILLQMVRFESETAFSFWAADSPIFVETKSRAAVSTSSCAMIWVFLHFAILYAILKDASCALAGVCKKFENTTNCLFIFDSLRVKNWRDFLDKLLWFVVKWRFSLLGSTHSAAKTSQQITHCGCSIPFLSATVTPKLR